MPRTISRPGLMAGTLAALAACGTSRVVERTKVGGVIEISGDRSTATERANRDMAAHCGPDNFMVVRDGQEPVGSETAWRLHYRCGRPPVGAARPTPIEEPEPPPTAR